MPTSFHHHHSSSDGSQVEINNQDPSKLFVELTEIGHGNFGAVYYVFLILFKLKPQKFI